MTPDNYVVIYQKENEDRIFVLITSEFGDFVLSKNCKGDGCRCLGCTLFTVKVVTIDNQDQFSILDSERKKY